MFFRLEKNCSKTIWKLYHRIKDGGFLYFTHGDNQIQVTTEQQIKFYKIDEDTDIPSLDHVLSNFVGCTSMMFGLESKYCITYKMGEVGVNIYKRKFIHTFLATLNTSCFEQSTAVSVNQIQQYLISFGNKIKVFD